MKKLLLSAVLCCGFITTTFAISTDTLRTQMRSTGDLYQCISRAIPNGRMVVPYGLDVTFDKTTHLIFPVSFDFRRPTEIKNTCTWAFCRPTEIKNTTSRCVCVAMGRSAWSSPSKVSRCPTTSNWRSRSTNETAAGRSLFTCKTKTFFVPAASITSNCNGDETGTTSAYRHGCNSPHSAFFLSRRASKSRRAFR